MGVSTELVNLSSVVSSISLALIAAGGLYFTILSFMKNRSNVKVIYLSIFPKGYSAARARPFSAFGLNHIVITVSNIGQRSNSVIGVRLILKNGNIMPVPLLELPLFLRESCPEKISFDLLEDNTYQLEKIVLTTAAKKEVEVNQKWIKEQIESLKSFYGEKEKREKRKKPQQ